MKNDKGFTLVEVLAVIVVISLILVLVIPNFIGAGDNAKKKLLKTKLDLMESQLIMYASDHKNCFYSTNTMDCPIINNCNISGDKTASCDVEIALLAQFGYIKYDEGENVINPYTNEIMNDETITITINEKKKIKITGTSVDID